MKLRAVVPSLIVGLTALAAVAAPASAANQIYWANAGNDTLSFANLDGTGSGGQLSTTGTTVNLPVGTAIDPATNKIYWANEGANTISFANLDGTGAGTLDTTGASVNNPTGVAVYPAANKIYWVNGGDSTVSFANLDNTGGGGQLNITGATPDSPVGVAIDPAANKIYWVNGGDSTVSFANLDNTGGGGQLSTTGATVSLPQGLSVDPAAGKVFWTNFNDDTISFANENDTGGGGLLPTTGATPSEPNMPSLLEVPGGAGAPAVSGGSTAGSLLSCSQGAWASDVPASSLYRAPRSFAYSWTLNGTPISGASSNTIIASSPGDYACQVTAHNHAGASTQTSAPHTVSSPPPATPPAVIPAAAPKPLKLSVSPHSTVAGTRACYSFTATSSGHRVAGVTIRFTGHTAHTSSHGKARICETLRRHGTYKAHASKSGYRSATARVTVKAKPTPKAKPKPLFTG